MHFSVISTLRTSQKQENRPMNMKKSIIVRALSWCWKTVKRFFKWYFSLYRKPWYVKAVTIVLSLIVLIFMYFGMVDINFLGLFGRSPGFAQIKDPITYEASEIYSADSVMIGKFFNENRTPVKYEDVNPSFWSTLVAVEDERFYKHHGIDLEGLVAALKDAVLKHEGRGASTITQQLAKNMFRVRTEYSTGILGNIPGLKLLIMKSKEWIIATKIEMIYDKKDILVMYANTVDFGSNAYGIKTACKTYFGTTPNKLTFEQSAVLVGMLKATTYYNPIVNPSNCLKRRNVILTMLADKGIISTSESDSLKKVPIKLDYSVENNYDGQALYFRAAVAKELSEWCKDKGYDLYSNGLKIYTTIDTRMQKMAEEAVTRQMRIVQRNFNNHWGKEEPWQDERHHVIEGFIEDIAQRLPVYKQLTKKFPNSPDSVEYYLNMPHKVTLFDYEKGTIEAEMSTMDSIRYMVRFMHCAFVAMEPQTGHVKAWVGDIDFDTWKYDKVKAMRQPGSTFKLFVYTEAMNQGLSPCDLYRDEYISMDVYDAKKDTMTRWTPTNADGHFTGDTMPLKAAFARSVNSIAVRLGQDMGISNIASTAHDMGIVSPLDETPSLALGSSDVNLLEMANAYSCIANNGKHVEPVLVTMIIDKDGNVVYRAPQTEKLALTSRTAFLVQQLLMGGMREPGGTSMALWSFVRDFVKDTDFGGKTGTSNNHSDAWFMAVTPNIVCGAWVGGEYRCIHFRTGALGQGSRTALPVCGYFLQSLLSDDRFAKYHGKFQKPDDKSITYGMYNCPSYYGHRVDTVDTDSVPENDSTSVGNGMLPDPNDINGRQSVVDHFIGIPAQQEIKIGE